MRDYINIGSAPCDEDCAQVGQPNYASKAQQECGRFIEAIRSKLGPEPQGAELRVKGFPHDFGRYYEVVCYFDDNNEAAMEYAFKCEAEAPTTWPKPEPVESIIYTEQRPFTVGAVLKHNVEQQYVKAHQPSVETMAEWLSDGIAQAVDGCEVEPDGKCCHGSPSWLLQMGVI